MLAALSSYIEGILSSPKQLEKILTQLLLILINPTWLKKALKGLDINLKQDYQEIKCIWFI